MARPPYVAPMGRACRSGSDCDAPEDCLHPDLPICASDVAGPCGPGRPCATGDVCANPDCEEYARCVADCRTGGGCEQPGQTCDASTGLCLFSACEVDGVPCASGRVCDPDAPDADTNGCAAASCVDDADCPCGPCVNGRCASDLGVCAELIFG